MTTPAHEIPTDRVSKVSFNPVSDSTGNQALIVTIRSVAPQPEDIPKTMEKTRRSMSFDSKKSETKRKTRSRNQGNSKSTMTEPIENQASGSIGDVSGLSGVVFNWSLLVTGVLLVNWSFWSTGVASGSTGVASGSTGVASGSIGVASGSTGVASGSTGVGNGSTVGSDLTGVASSHPVVVSGSPGDDSSPSKSVTKAPGFTDAPCLKHAAENISRKASDIGSEKMSLCNNCSKSMLSYIFVVQDFLESLAKEIVGQSDSQNCIQCLREETRKSLSGIKDDENASRSESKRTSKIHTKAVGDSKSEERSFMGKEPHTRTKTSSREVRRYEETSDQLIERSLAQHRQTRQQDRSNFLSSNLPNLQGNAPSDQQGSNQAFQSSSQNDQIGHRGVDQEMLQNRRGDHQSHMEPHQAQGHQNQQEGSQSHSVTREQGNSQPYADEPTLDEEIPTRRPFNRHGIDHRREVESNVFGDANVDGVMSALSNAEREIYEEARNISGYEGMGEDASRNNSGWGNGARNNSGWENDARNISGSEDVARDISGFGGMGEDSARNISSREGPRLVSSLPSPVTREAYVTTCRNNAEALGCLVVGTSLLLSRTNRTLCVLMSDGVSNAFRGPLSCVFHHVVSPKSLDALGSTKLSLLEQPELGVSFDKLNVWRLVQFDKCVYLNSDTLVLQNCDELFCRAELSAVSDIGWPDCFNSGVFVFVPSLQTFWGMVDYAEKNGSYDGGDQGLLNSYFSSWSEDITKKLSFIYNLMANVSYTYVPAFKQFGRNVKVFSSWLSRSRGTSSYKTVQISQHTPLHLSSLYTGCKLQKKQVSIKFGRNVKVVQFMGSSKPWHVKFFSKTGQISPDTPVHAMYAQFVHVWINIFRVAALRQLPQNIRSYAQSQEVISAVELLRFFPLPLESEADFFLTPPSVRMRRVERRLEASPTTSKASQDARRRKSAIELPSKSVAERQSKRLDAKSDSERDAGTTDVERPDAERDVGLSDADKVAEMKYLLKRTSVPTWKVRFGDATSGSNADVVFRDRRSEITKE
ncbi:hypothetical protein JTE90_003528 [Oedothorax gibbosus]|uniref:glycogenin glucosyltransferase n=1 Tax=Oedothorax gibbosus TaxID=931172 RepID=A0AAV6UP58_9ARAC|nr:hypothetical protein JTE90_003528 [Oedothorax gibbosus]